MGSANVWVRLTLLACVFAGTIGAYHGWLNYQLGESPAYMIVEAGIAVIGFLGLTIWGLYYCFNKHRNNNHADRRRKA